MTSIQTQQESKDTTSQKNKCYICNSRDGDFKCKNNGCSHWTCYTDFNGQRYCNYCETTEDDQQFNHALECLKQYLDNSSSIAKLDKLSILSQFIVDNGQNAIKEMSLIHKYSDSVKAKYEQLVTICNKYNQ